MSTLIKLEPPYSNDWSRGYLVTNSERRRTVILYNSDSHRSSVSYARYLVSVDKGRYLTEFEQVDHIDNDKTNDVLTNLQILSPIENIQKSAPGRTLFDFVCGWCNTTFQLEARQMHKKRKIPPCCSRSCSAKLQRQ